MMNATVTVSIKKGDIVSTRFEFDESMNFAQATKAVMMVRDEMIRQVEERGKCPAGRGKLNRSEK